jgi:integrase
VDEVGIVRERTGCDIRTSRAIAKGMSIEVAQQNLGHASLATTTVHVTTEAKRRLRAVKGFWGEK